MIDIKIELQKHLDDIIKFFHDEISSIRGSRPTPALVEDIWVEYYGQKTPVKQLGSIMVVPPREIQVNVWDVSAVNAVAKAISEKLNIQTSPDGNTIHANLPSLTQERRDEMVKVVKAKAEETRIKSRTVRDEIKKKISDQEKAGEMTEDDRESLGEEMQKIMDKFNEQLETMLEKKIGEISE